MGLRSSQELKLHNASCQLTFFTQISGRNFLPKSVERLIPELPLSKLCAVPFALQNRALFEGEKRAKLCREKGRKRGGQERGQKGKKDARKQVSQTLGQGRALTTLTTPLIKGVAGSPP